MNAMAEPKTKRKLKNWLAGYLEYTKASEAPESFHLWTGISTIASVLQRKVWIEERIFQWTPNFYIIFVGPAGVVTKSTSVRLGARLLKDIEGINFGPNSLTWNALTVALEEAQVAIPEIAGQMDSALHHMSCITCSVNELGTFLDPSDRKLVDVFTDLWDGQVGVWEHSTKTTGSTVITNPWLNIIAATTPSWLRENFPESMIGGGLASRMVFVYGDKKRQLVAYPHLVQTDKEYDKLEAELIADLKVMNEMMGEYKLTDDAIAWGAAWYEKHWTTRPEHLASEKFEGYLARKQTHMHKLAIVLAASKRNELKITQTDLVNADKMVSLLERDMMKVFQAIGATEEFKNVYTIIKVLITFGNTLDNNELFAKVANAISVQDYNEALSSGIKSGYLQMSNVGTSTKVQLLKIPEDLVSAHGRNHEGAEPQGIPT